MFDANSTRDTPPAAGNSRATSAAPPPAVSPPRRLRVASLLIAANAAILVACAIGAAPPGSVEGRLWRLLGADLTPALIDAGAFAGYLLEAGEYWRLFASLFLHQGLIHLLVNMFALFFLAVWLEAPLGPWRFLALYLLSGAAGNLFAYGLNVLYALAAAPSFSSMRPSVGASGAVFGLLGALVAAEWVARGSLRALFLSPQSRRMLTAVVLIFMVDLIVPNVDGKAHFGGFAAGIAIGLFFLGRNAAINRPGLRALGLNAAYGLAACCAVALFAATRPVQSASEEDRTRDTVVISLLADAWGRADLALKWVERRVAASGADQAADDAHWAEHYVDLLQTNCRYDEARRRASLALDRNIEPASMCYRRGLSNWRLGELEQADKDFTEATRIATQETTGAPELWVDALGMSHALLLLKLGRQADSDALRDALAARFLAEADAATSAARALSAARVAQSRPATSWLERLLGAASGPAADSPREQLYLAATKGNSAAWLYATLNCKLDEGVALIEQALEIAREPAFIDTLGWLLYRQGKHAEALQVLYESLRGQPVAHAEIYYHVGAVCAALGQYIEARRYLEKALRMKQDFDAIDDARALLENLGPPAAETPEAKNLT